MRLLFVCVCVFGSQTRHVKLNFCFSTESQQAACLAPIKSTTSVSFLILENDVKTNKWYLFTSEVNWLLFHIPPGLSVPAVYDHAALRLSPVRRLGNMWSNRLTKTIFFVLSATQFPSEATWRVYSEWSRVSGRRLHFTALSKLLLCYYPKLYDCTIQNVTCTCSIFWYHRAHLQVVVTAFLICFEEHVG